MINLLRLLCAALIGLLRCSTWREAEILVLRHQLNVPSAKTAEFEKSRSVAVRLGYLDWSRQRWGHWRWSGRKPWSAGSALAFGPIGASNQEFVLAGRRRPWRSVNSFGTWASPTRSGAHLASMATTRLCQGRRSWVRIWPGAPLRFQIFTPVALVCTENLIRIDCATESPKRQWRWSRCSAFSWPCSPRRSSQRADLRQRTRHSDINWLCCGGGCAVASNSQMGIACSWSSCIDGSHRSSGPSRSSDHHLSRQCEV